MEILPPELAAISARGQLGGDQSRDCIESYGESVRHELITVRHPKNSCNSPRLA